MNRKKEMGRVDYSGLVAPPEKHERITAKYFADRGKDVVFIRPKSIKGANNPDFNILRFKNASSK